MALDESKAGNLRDSIVPVSRRWASRPALHSLLLLSGG